MCVIEKVEPPLLEAGDPAWSVGAGRGKRSDGAACAERQPSPVDQLVRRMREQKTSFQLPTGGVASTGSIHSAEAVI